VTNKYQKNTPKTSAGPGLAVPDEVTVAVSEIADDMREGLLALAVGAGLQVMSSLMEADVAAACGPRGRHDPERTVVRHGSERGSVTVGGRRVGVQRPRIRATGGGEVPVPAYDLFSRSEILGRMAMSKMLGGLSSRRYAVGLEPVGQKVERAASTTSKSAVSRRFVAMTETALGELLAAPLGQLDLVALMIDGVHFGPHLCVVALGIGIDGTKHPLGLVEGSTENTTVVTDLLTDPRERGLDTTRPILVGIDGGKALHAAVMARVLNCPWSESVRAVPARELQLLVGFDPFPGLPGAGRLLVHVGGLGTQGGVGTWAIRQRQQVAGDLSQDHCSPGQVRAEVGGQDRIDEFVGACTFLFDKPAGRGPQPGGSPMAACRRGELPLPSCDSELQDVQHRGVLIRPATHDAHAEPATTGQRCESAAGQSGVSQGARHRRVGDWGVQTS
jgi:hypothetical protein